uniref:Uncharacterized protein n=1 Tax=Ditylenchus dipsaci TaxID=166011 RepID=A0A915EJE1_9BILA
MIMDAYREHVRKHSWSDEQFEKFSLKAYLLPDSDFMTSIWSTSYSNEPRISNLQPQQLERFWDYVESKKTQLTASRLHSLSFEMLKNSPKHPRARSAFNGVLPVVEAAEREKLLQCQAGRDEMCRRLPLQDWKTSVFKAYCKSVYTIATHLELEPDDENAGKADEKEERDVDGEKMSEFIKQQLNNEEAWNLGHVFQFLSTGQLPVDIPSTKLKMVQANVINVAKAYALLLSDGVINNDIMQISSVV